MDKFCETGWRLFYYSVSWNQLKDLNIWFGEKLSSRLPSSLAWFVSGLSPGSGTSGCVGKLPTLNTNPKYLQTPNTTTLPDILIFTSHAKPSTILHPHHTLAIIVDSTQVLYYDEVCTVVLWNPHGKVVGIKVNGKSLRITVGTFLQKKSNFWNLLNMARGSGNFSVSCMFYFGRLMLDGAPDCGKDWVPSTLPWSPGATISFSFEWIILFFCTILLPLPELGPEPLLLMMIMHPSHLALKTFSLVLSPFVDFSINASFPQTCICVLD